MRDNELVRMESGESEEKFEYLKETGMIDCYECIYIFIYRFNIF